MSKIKVLMIDDNISLVEMVKEYFKENQYPCSIKTWKSYINEGKIPWESYICMKPGYCKCR